MLGVVAIAMAIGTIWFGQAALAAFNGAIYTSTADGTVVDKNIYDSKDDVYLNGGPQNSNANGLPSGEYYFQVTTPSGALLLSTDPVVCRQINVANGVVSGVGADAVTAGCAHAIGAYNPANKSTPVQLQPFNDTTNSGGEYKVWLIRKASTTSPAQDGFHLIFSGANEKSDNFKIKPSVPPPCIPGVDPECTAPTFSISGTKFYDANADGVSNDGQAVGGVQINIHLVDPVLGESDVIVFTNGDGSWSLSNLNPGTTYTVSETLPPDCPDGSHWVQTAPAADSSGNRVYSGTISTTNVTGLDFGNLCEHPGTGGFTLGFWSNNNGSKAMNGQNAGGQNGATSDVYVFYADGTLTDNASCANAATQGLNCDLAFLRRFNLFGESATKKQTVTTAFNPGSYNDFRSWILSANAYNMSYMLSAQLAATSLDVRHGSLNDSTIVDANSICNTVGSCLGFVSIGQVRQLANESLGANGGNTTISGDSQRDSQELMKNFLDAVNNNRLYFVNSTPCCVVYPAPVIAQ